MTLTRFVEPSGIVPASVVLPDWSRPRLDPSSLAVHGVGASAAAAVCDAAAALSELNGNASETLGLAKAFARLTLWRSCCAAATDAIEHELQSGKLPKVPKDKEYRARAGQILSTSAIAAGMSPPDRGRAMPKAMEQSINAALFVEALARVNPDLQATLLSLRPTERALRVLYRFGSWQETLPHGTRRFQPEIARLRDLIAHCHDAMATDGTLGTDAGLSGAMAESAADLLFPVADKSPTKTGPVGPVGPIADPDAIADPDPTGADPDPVGVAMNALANHSAGLLSVLSDLSAMTAADHGAIVAAMDSLIADVSVVLSAMAPTPEPTPEPTPAPKRKRKAAAVLTPQQAMAL